MALGADSRSASPTPDHPAEPEEGEMNDRLVEAAIDAVRKIHADTRVGKRTTISRLRDIQEEISSLISAIEEDIRREEK